MQVASYGVTFDPSQATHKYTYFICKTLIVLKFCFRKMSDIADTEMVFVKEECGIVDVKLELVEDENPLNLEEGNF